MILPTRLHRGAPPLRLAVALASALAAFGLGLAVLPAPAAAAPGDAHAFAEPIFSANARGDIVTIGNVTTTCDPTYEGEQWTAAESARACNAAISGAPETLGFDGRPIPPINNRLSMRDVDVDGVAATFNSSSARLDLPPGAEVLWAGLHWNAATDAPRADALYGSSFQLDPRDVAARFRVRLDTPAPGGAVALDASSADGTTTDRWDDTNPGGTVSYGGFVDVTDLVADAGSGTYTVADVQSCRGFGGCFGSWSLTVVLADADLPPRNLNVWHGWQLTSPSIDGGTQQFSINGILPPPRGPVQARIGVVQADGDRGLGPDSLEISSPSHPTWKPFQTADRPLNPNEGDWFNSTVNAYGQRRADAAASPNLLANLNQDIALVEDDGVIGNTDEAFSFRVRTTSTESLYSQVVHSAVDLFAPEIAIAKSVEPATPVGPGDEVTWTLDVRNVGIDPIRKAVVVDPLPNGVVYVPGSVRYAAGGPAELLGPKSDAPGDDQVDVNLDDSTLTFRIGTGANGTDGGTMGIDPALDGSHELTITFRTTVDAAPGTTVENEATARGEGRELDDPFGPLTTEAADPATASAAPASDLGITKTDGGAVVRAVGDRFTYGLTARNAGPSAATGVQVTDRLDDHLRFVDSDDGCVAAGQEVTCGVGDLAVGEEVERTFVVEVVRLPGEGRPIPNVAAVDGNEPNPDCTDEAPEALCNEDDEETPQEPSPTTTAPTTSAAPTTAPTTRPTGPTPTTVASKAPPAASTSGPTGFLPRTGAGMATLTAVGLATVGLGSAVLAVRQRRRREVAEYVATLRR